MLYIQSKDIYIYNKLDVQANFQEELNDSLVDFKVYFISN